SYAVESVIQWPKPIALSSSAKAITDLIDRVLDGAPVAQLFQVSINADLAINGKDVFQLSNGSSSGSILISASSGVAAAMGFNYYLKYVAQSSCMKKFSFSFCFTIIDVSCSLLVRQEYSPIWIIINSIIYTDSNSRK
ncbi:unnamed protein product, partial [Rotaria magnacalcarata]